MGEHTLFLIRSAHPAWQTLRTALATWPEVQLAGEARTVERARLAIPPLAPDLIVTAELVNGKPVQSLLAHVRRCCPASRVLVLIDTPGATALAEMAALRIEGALLWRDVNPIRFRHAVTTLLDDGFVLGSYQLAQGFYDGAQTPAPPPRVAPALSPRERHVLARLWAGETHQSIAGHEAMSVRTVDRLVANLYTRLNVASPLQLGNRAAQLGLIDEPLVAEPRQEWRNDDKPVA